MSLPCTGRGPEAATTTTTTVAAFRVKATLGAIGRPILLSGVSTLVAVGLLGNVASYMIRVFLKTIFLVVGFGLAHALLLLPLIFYLTDGDKWEATRPNSSQQQQQPCKVKVASAQLAKTLAFAIPVIRRRES